MKTSPAALPRSMRRPLGAAAVLGVLVVLVQALVYAGDTTGEWAAPQPWLSGFLYYVATAVDFLGEPVGAVLLMVVLIPVCWFTGHRRTAVTLPLAACVTVGVTTLLKPLVDRQIHGGYLSYPSGHTAFATTVGLTLALGFAHHLRRGAALALVAGVPLLAGAVMGWTEVALSAHYPTDTVGGLATGVAVVPAVGWVVDLCWTRFKGGQASR